MTNPMNLVPNSVNVAKSLVFLVICFNRVEVEGQFDNSDNQFDDATCKRFCHDDCHKYFNSNSGDFSTCVSANVRCSCGLPWQGILIVVLGVGIFLGIAVIALCRFFCVSYFSSRGPATSTHPATQTANYPRQGTGAYAGYTGGVVPNVPITGYVPTQPPYNPAFTPQTATAPGAEYLNPDSRMPFPAGFQIHDGPPKYDEVVKPF